MTSTDPAATADALTDEQRQLLTLARDTARRQTTALAERMAPVARRDSLSNGRRLVLAEVEAELHTRALAHGWRAAVDKAARMATATARSTDAFDRAVAEAEAEAAGAWLRAWGSMAPAEVVAAAFTG